ncbi:MAG: histidine kinase dimerization/phospho-acceptor domain-containing protein [Acetatifactor sp.]
MRKKKMCVYGRQKRRSFAGLFLRQWILVMVVCGLLGALVLVMFTDREKNQQLQEFSSEEEIRVGNIQKMPAEDIYLLGESQRLKGAIKAEGYGIATQLYKTDTREVLAGCEEQLFIIRRKTESTPTRIYSYPVSRIPGWKEYREQVSKLEGVGKVLLEDVSMPYFYLSGEDILPGPITMTVSELSRIKYEFAWDGEITDSIFTYSIEEPASIPEGYEKVMLSSEPSEFFQPLLVGVDASNPELKFAPWGDDSFELMQEVFQKTVETGQEEEYYLETFFTVTEASFRRMELLDGSSVTLLSCLDYDLLEVWGGVIAGVTAVTVILGSLIAFVMAKIKYAGLKAGYDMEDYRRDLMNTLAHDLKSPLMSISGYAENLEGNLVPEKQAHYTGAIRENVQYMNRMIESVLELSKVEMGTARLKKETVDMKALFEEVRKRYEDRLADRKLSITAEGALTWQADRQMMGQVLDNLLDNAVRYADPGSTVQVQFSDKGLRFCNPCATDLSGSVEKLADPFVVGSESRSGKTGSGLGLAIVKNICELHGLALQIQYQDGVFSIAIG